MLRRMFPTLPLTRSAEVFLFPIGSTTVVYQRIASAVGTLNRDRYHATFHLSSVSCSYSLTSFPFWPLPSCDNLLLFTVFISCAQPEGHMARLHRLLNHCNQCLLQLIQVYLVA